jgi:hypothetical protein
VEQFYRNFLSYRWVGERLVIRMQRPLTEASLLALREDFEDLLGENPLEQTVALPEERNEPQLAGFPRLVFLPAKKNFGRLRQFINAVNSLQQA